MDLDGPCQRAGEDPFTAGVRRHVDRHARRESAGAHDRIAGSPVGAGFTRSPSRQSEEPRASPDPRNGRGRSGTGVVRRAEATPSRDLVGRLLGRMVSLLRGVPDEICLSRRGGRIPRRDRRSHRRRFSPMGLVPCRGHSNGGRVPTGWPSSGGMVAGAKAWMKETSARSSARWRPP